MSALEEVEAAVRAAQAVAPELPIAVTMSFDTNLRTMMGVTPAQAVQTISGWGVRVVGANCGRGPDEIETIMGADGRGAARRRPPDGAVQRRPAEAGRRRLRLRRHARGDGRLRPPRSASSASPSSAAAAGRRRPTSPRCGTRWPSARDRRRPPPARGGAGRGAARRGAAGRSRRGRATVLGPRRRRVDARGRAAGARRAGGRGRGDVPGRAGAAALCGARRRHHGHRRQDDRLPPAGGDARRRRAAVRDGRARRARRTPGPTPTCTSWRRCSSRPPS